MSVEITGYLKDNEGIYIQKDRLARLIYTFDWVDWLPSGDSVSTASYSLQVRANDPAPLIKHTEGVSGTKSYVELSGGQLGKIYTVTATITTANGLTDRRNFRIKVENRSA